MSFLSLLLWLGVFWLCFQIKNETNRSNPQQNITSIDDFRSLSKQVVTKEVKSSCDSFATLIEREPDAKDAIENKMEDIAEMQDIVNLEDPDLPKEVTVNDNSFSGSHAITINHSQTLSPFHVQPVLKSSQVR